MLHSLIVEGTLLVDIGTDHARLPIAALRSERCPAAIGIDIHAQPLARARNRARAAGVEDRLHLYHGDALVNLCVRVPCTLVAAGIGGNLIAQNVQQWLRRVPNLRALVLNPMSEERIMRTALYHAGLRCDAQTLVQDSGRIFLVERWLSGDPSGAPSDHAADPFTSEDIILGTILRRGDDPLWGAWLHTQRSWLERTLDALPSGPRRTATTKHLAVITRAINETSHSYGARS